MKHLFALLIVFSLPAAAQLEPQPPVDLPVRVVDDTGAPVAGIEVVCVNWFYEGPPRTEPPRKNEKAVTGADGRCTFTGLVWSDYSIYAFHGDLSAIQRAYPRQLKDGPFELKLQPHPPVNIQLRDLRGRPVPGALVLENLQVPLGYSDSEGRVRFASLPRTRLSFLKPGYGYMSHSSPEGDVELFLTPGTVVEFTVVDEEGNPAPEAKVRYHYDQCEYEAEAENDGKFKTIELSRGMRVSANASYSTDQARWLGNTGVEVGPGPVQQVEIRLEKTAERKPAAAFYPGAPYPPGRVMLVAAEPQPQGMVPLEVHYVSGKVVMAGTGEPVQARLYSSWERDRYDLESRGRTGPDGTFRLDTSKFSGYLFVHPEDPRYYAVESPIVLNDKSMENLVFTVKPGGSLRGHVVDHMGKPVRANVLLRNFALQTFSDERGYFSITNLPPVSDHYVLSAGKDTEVKVPAPPPGTLVKDIVIQLPDPGEGTLVEGLVVNGEGAPAGGVNVTLKQQVEGKPNYEHLTTDSRGRFSLRFKNPGPVELEVSKPMQVAMSNDYIRTARPCPVREGGRFDVTTAGPPQQVRVVVDMPPPEIPIVAGWVEDDQGRPLEVAPRAYTEHGIRQTYSCGNSFFMLVPSDALLIEFTLENYQGRVLQSGRDFEIGDRSLRVVLKKGPYGADESVWTAATGLPESYEPEQGSLMQRYANRRKIESEFERLAGRKGGEKETKSEEVAARPQAPQVPREINLVVTDPDGKPVTEITCQAARARGMDSPIYLSQTNAEPMPGQPKRLLTDPNGRYRVPNISLVSAPEMAQRLVAVQPGQHYEPPLKITLGPPASFTVCVLDLKGNPVSGAAVGPLDDMAQHMSNNYHYLPKTGADGRLCFEGLPAGSYLLAVARPIGPGDRQMRGPEREFAAAELDWGESVEKAVRIGKPEPGSVEAMLDDWRDHTYRREEIDQAVEALDDAARRDLKRAVLQQLREIPMIVRLNAEQVIVLARVAAELELGKAVKPLQALFPSGQPEDVHYPAPSYQPYDAVMDALIRLAGEKTAGYFESVAGDAEAEYKARVQALIGLGRIGTDESVAAFKRLRDAAYGKNGAPERRETYTCGERMAETAVMIMHYIPGGDAKPQVRPLAETAWVSEDYNEGRVTWPQYSLHFKRFGDEWLLVEMESLPMP